MRLPRHPDGEAVDPFCADQTTVVQGMPHGVDLLRWLVQAPLTRGS